MYMTTNNKFINKSEGGFINVSSSPSLGRYLYLIEVPQLLYIKFRLTEGQVTQAPVTICELAYVQYLVSAPLTRVAI